MRSIHLNCFLLPNMGVFNLLYVFFHKENLNEISFLSLGSHRNKHFI